MSLVLHVEIAKCLFIHRKPRDKLEPGAGGRGRLGDVALVGAGDAGQAHDALVCLVQLPLRQKGVDGRARADVPATGDQHLPLALRALVRAMVFLRRRRLVHSTAASHGPLVRVMHCAQKALTSAVRRWTFYVRGKKDFLVNENTQLSSFEEAIFNMHNKMVAVHIYLHLQKLETAILG